MPRSARAPAHVNLFVDDLERSTRFYNEVCGLALEFRELGLRASFMGTGNTPHDVGMIETTKGRDRYGRDGHLQLPKEVGAKVGLNHIAWEIDNKAELVEGYRRVRARGLPIRRLADHQVAHSVYLGDPDGNTVEFYVDTVRDWRAVLHGDLDLITSTWDPEAGEPCAEPRYDPDPPLRRVPQAAFHPRRLTHVVLATHDVPRLQAFYEEVAGLETVQGAPDEGLALMRGHHAVVPYHLAIVAARDGIPAGLHHFALELAEAGGAAQPDVECRVDTAAKTSAFLIDPDGFRVELFTPAQGSRRPDLQGDAPLAFLV